MKEGKREGETERGKEIGRDKGRDGVCVRKRDQEREGERGRE